MSTQPQITFAGALAQIRFNEFDLAAYEVFLKAKTLPEKRVEYDWKTDTYRITTPARFAGMLGVENPPVRQAPLPLSEYLFDYQKFIVAQALEAQRYAIFADCGLGKTGMLLEFARQVIHITGKKSLILSPLQVIQQTRQESRRFYGDALPVLGLDTREALITWLQDGRGGLAITNYEKLSGGEIPELRNLAALILDESSMLKSGGGVIKWNLIHSATGIEYKLSCTATPAPNEVMEYASQGSFLEKLLNEGEILWTFFSRNKQNEWVIKPHARAGFYRFLASWSCYLRNPAAYGFADNLASIPKPEFHLHRIEATEDQEAFARRLFVDCGAGLHGDRGLGVTQRLKLSQAAKGFQYQANSAIRIPSRKPAFIADLVSAEMAAGHQVLLWTVFDEESDILSELLAARGCTAAVLQGSTPAKRRAQMIEEFRTGQLPCLVSKAGLLGFGMNFQACTSMVFSGWDDSYERFYQAVRRAYRYGQTRTVRIHLPYIELLEGVILENVFRKQASFGADAEQQEYFYRDALSGLLPGGIRV